MKQSTENKYDGAKGALLRYFVDGSDASYHLLENAITTEISLADDAKRALLILFKGYPHKGEPSRLLGLGVDLMLDLFDLRINLLRRTVKVSLYGKIISRGLNRRLGLIPPSLQPIVRLIAIQHLCKYRYKIVLHIEDPNGDKMDKFQKGYLRVMVETLRDIQRSHPDIYLAVRAFVIVDRDRVFFARGDNRDRFISRKVGKCPQDFRLIKAEIFLLVYLTVRMDLTRISAPGNPAQAIEEAYDVLDILRREGIVTESVLRQAIDLMSGLLFQAARFGMHQFKRMAAEIQRLSESAFPSDDMDRHCNEFKINYEIGKKLMAAKHYREAGMFIERSLGALNTISDNNKYVQKYYRYQRHCLEALLEQSRLKGEEAIESLKMACWSVEILRNDWRCFSGRKQTLPTSGRRAANRWSFRLVKVAFFARIFVGCLSERYKEFLYLSDRLKWPNPGNSLQVTKLVEGLEYQLDLANNGFKLRKEDDASVHRFNLAERELDSEAVPFLLGMHAKYSEELLSKEKVVEFHNLSGGKNGARMDHSGYGVTFAQQALRFCRNPSEFPPDIRPQEFILFAANKLKQDLDRYIFSVSTVVLQFMRELSEVVKIVGEWRLMEAVELLEITQFIIDRLENERQSIIHQDDRSIVDKILETIFLGISQSLLIAGEKSRGGSGMLLLEHAIFWQDRARYRWLSVGYNRGMISRIDSLDISSSLRNEFFAAEEMLRVLIASRPSRFVFGKTTGEKRGHEAPSAMRGSRSKYRSPGASDVEISRSYDKAQKDYLQALHKIKKVLPEFDWEFQSKALLPIKVLGGRLRNEIVIHFILSEGKVHVVIHYRRKFRVLVVDDEFPSRMFRRRVRGVLSGEQREKDRCVLSSIHDAIKRFVSDAARRRSSEAGCLRLFVDPVFTSLPVHRLVGESRLPQIVHGCSVSSAAMNMRSSISEAGVTVIAPYKELKYSAIEARLCWKISERLIGKQTISEVVDVLNRATILHYCGHLELGDGGGLLCPVKGGILNMDLAWLIENLSFSARPLVILNACRSGVSNNSQEPEVFEREKDYRRETEIKKARVSYASCFLSLGASAVVATAWDVDDCVAFVFAWKLSRNIARYPGRTIDEVFFKAIAWCKSLTGSDCGASKLEPLIASLSDRERSMFAAKIPQKIQEEQERVADELGVDCWDAFLLYR